MMKVCVICGKTMCSGRYVAHMDWHVSQGVAARRVPPGGGDVDYYKITLIRAWPEWLRAAAAEISVDWFCGL